MFFSRTIPETDSSFNTCSFPPLSSTCRQWEMETFPCTEWAVGRVPNAACTASQETGTRFSLWCLQWVKCSATADFELQIISAFIYFFKLFFTGAFDSRKNYPQLHKLPSVSVCSELCPHAAYISQCWALRSLQEGHPSQGYLAAVLLHALFLPLVHVFSLECQQALLPWNVL